MAQSRTATQPALIDNMHGALLAVLLMVTIGAFGLFCALTAAFPY
ncbi:hypothetical protein AB0M22_31145 [Nocardia sp. NPDC051756]